MSQEDPGGVVQTLPGSWAPPGSRTIELVFRTIGERTSELALELALKHIRPQRAHVLKNVTPWTVALRRMLEIEHQCSHVVYVDADCLILEDMRPFLDANDRPHVDCYVRDRFRGRVHCGVHITRLDVVRAMRGIPGPADVLHYVLSPEGYLRGRALHELHLSKQLKGFHILHDHFQSYRDIFVKYARRELRSRRQESYRAALRAGISGWGGDAEFEVARRAVQHAAQSVPLDATTEQIGRYLRDLPSVAEDELRVLCLAQQDHVRIDEVEKAVANDSVNLGRTRSDVKVFGVGLSCTGAHLLTAALHILGFDTVYYPTDRATLDTLARGDARFPLLEHYDGITDITVVPYYEALDRAWPGSKFILTVHDIDSWLGYCAAEWTAPVADEIAWCPVRRGVQQFLWAAVYGSYEFNEERFRRVYQRHVEDVIRYFAERTRDLLVLDIFAGDGYERLAPFLGAPTPRVPFPEKREPY